MTTQSTSLSAPLAHTDKGADHAHTIAYLRLSRTRGIGCITAHKLMNQCGSAQDALSYLHNTGRALYDEKSAHSEIDAHVKLGAHMITMDDPCYPPLLRYTCDYPLILSVLGNKNRLISPSIAIVGARQASLCSLKFAHNLARDLSQGGYTVVSGLARGIDGAAHAGAVDNGQTVAVVAGGVDTIYPREHAKLRQNILDHGGAIISEMPLGVFPGASHFPRRNRIISGMSRGLCVIEAAKQSGTMITARYALDQGRDIFAVPGSPLDARCGGSNQLLRDGAYFLESAHDIWDNLSPSVEWEHEEHPSRPVSRTLTSEKPPDCMHIPDHEKQPGSSARDHDILTIMGGQSLSLNDISNALNLDHSVLHAALISLEMEGRIQRDACGKFTRVY